MSAAGGRPEARDTPVGQDGPSNTGRLFVVSGPSGVGKSTVLARLRAELPDLWFSVSATTRPQRVGDVDGASYFFVSRDQFTEYVENGHMLEWAEFADNLYGTPLRPVAQRLAAGQDVLLEIEVQGARQVRGAMARPETTALVGAKAEVVMVFLAPPSFDELARRLIGRGTESAQVQQARLAAARSELAAEGEFDHTIVNHDVQAAVSALVELILDQRIHR